jgi:hypothetical protein
MISNGLSMDFELLLPAMEKANLLFDPSHGTLAIQWGILMAILVGF